MKHIKMLLACAIIVSTLQSTFAQKEIQANSKINKIIVYLTNAQVERSISVNLPTGNSEIIVSGLSQYLDPNSLRVSGKGDFVVLSQQVQIKYPEPVETSETKIPADIQKKINLLTDSLEQLGYDMSENQSRKEAWQFEKNILLGSKALTATDTITELRDGMAYYRTKIQEINSELLKINRKEKQLYKQKADMESRLTALKNYSSGFDIPKPTALPESVIRFNVLSDNGAPNATIEFSYLTSGVSWEPYYELKVEDIAKPVQLTLKANVSQNTGEPWNKTKLVFSTGKPAVYKTLPILNAWYLSYYMPHNYQTDNAYMKPTAASRSTDKAAKGEVYEDEETKFVYDYVQMSQNLLFAEYEVNLPYSIPSDGKTQTVSLMSSALNANYSYLAIPKVDKDAFLTAYLEGWEKLSLIQGKVNVIYQNAIISQTYINPAASADSLIVSLGTDKKVVVDRKKISDKSKDKVVGNIREQTMYMEITVKNQNQTEIQLTLKDQIPLGNNDIKVIADEYKDAKYNENNGELEWKLSLKPNETKKVTFRYTIKFDSTKSLILQ